jgi:hypothetical protein
VRHRLVAGPDEAGTTSAGWTARMIADVIDLRFPVDDAPRSVCHLLDHGGFSEHKGTVTAEHLNDAAALLGLKETWPQILRLAREKRAGVPRLSY